MEVVRRIGRGIPFAAVTVAIVACAAPAAVADTPTPPPAPAARTATPAPSPTPMREAILLAEGSDPNPGEKIVTIRIDES